MEFGTWGHVFICLKSGMTDWLIGFSQGGDAEQAEEASQAVRNACGQIPVARNEQTGRTLWDPEKSTVNACSAPQLLWKQARTRSPAHVLQLFQLQTEWTDVTEKF